MRNDSLYGSLKENGVVAAADDGRTDETTETLEGSDTSVGPPAERRPSVLEQQSRRKSNMAARCEVEL
ncbi:uncharacterized protein V6R79_024884 [Siganus canaliculatus]